MEPLVDPALDAYAAGHTTPPPGYLVALAAETERSLDAPEMMVGAVEGRFLQVLVHVTGARRVLEIGTFSGYSALSMAAGLPPGGSIVTCEVDARVAEVARRAVAASPHAGKVEVRVGPALDTLASLDGPFDLVFIDADKAEYVAYYEAVLPKLARRGLLVADNTLWGGRVLDEADASRDTAGIRAFNDHVASDRRVVCVQVPVRDGVTLVIRADPGP